MTERNAFRDSGELHLMSWVTVWKMQLVTAIGGGSLSSQEGKDLTENDGCRSCCVFCVCVLWFANTYLMTKPYKAQGWPRMANAKMFGWLWMGSVGWWDMLKSAIRIVQSSSVFVPSGKHTKKTMEHHHVIFGKIHYFYRFYGFLRPFSSSL